MLVLRSLVLATDMSQHFSILTSIQTKILNKEPGRKQSLDHQFASLDPEQQSLVLQLCIKAADLGHCCLPIRTHIKWVRRLQDEFWRQGDLEKKHGLPISPLADRNSPGALWGSSQVGFFKAIVCPLYSILTAIFRDCRDLEDGLLSNLEFWTKRQLKPLFDWNSS
uniref:3-cyclic-nucleotide phosphodiesterase n=1 Tax=Tetraselmis sp. GSL018 TaxID=582737 RepID=A0A061RWW8_9CHLO